MAVTRQVTITYNALVTRATTGAITNEALLDAGSAGQHTLQDTLIVNGKSTYLPIIRR
jgi:hypothetical protein